MPQKTRLLATHLVLVVVPAVVAVLLLADVGGEPAPDPLPESAAHGGAVPVWRFLLALAVIIAAARLFGSLGAMAGQPRVIGEMVSGIVLGPSVLGLIAPEAFGWVFGTGVLPYIQMVSQLGLAFFMFLVGMELDPGLLRGRGWAAGVVAQVSVAVPLVLGVAAGLAMYGVLGDSGSGRGTFALFVGVAMSVTAFPVLARILMERGMFQTPVGSLAMVCAAAADVIAWLLLAVVIAQVRNDEAVSIVWVLLLTLLFLAVMVGVVRPALRRLLTSDRRWVHEGGALGVVIVGVLASSVVADAIGIHLIFGAFLFGAICPRNLPALLTARGKIEDVTLSLLLPAFFAVVGLQTQIGLLGAQAEYWGWFAVMLVVAVAGKWVATTLASVGVGLGVPTSMRLGVLMNCKGLTELVILSVGLQVGILSPRLFTILVLVALIATVMTTPILVLLDRRQSAAGPVPAGTRISAGIEARR